MSGRSEGPRRSSPFVEVLDEEFAGWRRFTAENTWDAAGGPYYVRRDSDGAHRCAFRADERHLNVGGAVHGGCLLTFADLALFMLAIDALGDDGAVTVHLDTTFVDSAACGDLIEAVGEVTRAGGALVFVRGNIRSGSRVIATFCGILKRRRRIAATISV